MARKLSEPEADNGCVHGQSVILCSFEVCLFIKPRPTPEEGVYILSDQDGDCNSMPQADMDWGHASNYNSS